MDRQTGLPGQSIAVDLDGTLAEYHGWKGRDHVGEPIPAMMERVRIWIDGGMEVKIFTARCYQPENIPAIRAWLTKHNLRGLVITNVKDPGMIEIWDDRAIAVKFNTGELKCLERK